MSRSPRRSMSDMHYTALMLGAVYRYLSALDRGSPRFAWAGGVLAALAFLDRQVGFCLPIAFGAGVWFTNRRQSRQIRRLPLFVAGALIPLGFLVANRVAPGWLGGRTLAQGINTTSAVMVERLLDVETHVFEPEDRARLPVDVVAAAVPGVAASFTEAGDRHPATAAAHLRRVLPGLFDPFRRAPRDPWGATRAR